MVAEESAAKKTAASKKATDAGDGAAAAKKVPGKAAPAKKSAAKKATAKKATAKKTPAKKAGEKKAPAKKAPAKKAAAKGTAEEVAAAEGATAEVTAAEAAADRQRGAAQAPARQAAQTTTGAGTVAAKKTPAVTEAEAVPSARNGEGVAPGELPVRPDEDPWSPEEVEEARSGLRDEAERLRQEIISAEEALSGLMRDSGDGAGDDDADTGTKNITREHEMALAANAREMLYQSERALERLDAGTYGLCENCGRPIGKARMQAFPRATLCVECKQKQERR